MINLRKDEIRRTAIKLRFKFKSYVRIQRILNAKYNYQVSRKTIKRWYKKFNQGNWNLKDSSTAPYNLNYKFSREELEEAVLVRLSKGYSAYQIKEKLKKKDICISESTIKRVISICKLSRGNKMEGQRLKWLKFERDTPNSMWQLDATGYNSVWLLPVIDDCSRYCLGIAVLQNVTTENVIKFLEEIINMHGKPRELLTDNGKEYGGNGKGYNEFDKWCNRKGIKHIRTGLHKPTTVGKVGRLQFTITYELPYCFNDLEYFRWRYNTDRPHRSLNGLTPHEVYFGWKRHKKYMLDRQQIIKGVGGQMS